MQVVTSAQMRQIEENALRYDLTFHRLMENAGSAAAAFIRRTFPVEGRNCMIFCAKGNNGGDGLVVARKLHENGANVAVVLLDGIPTSDAAASMYNTAELMDLPMLDFAADAERVQAFLEQSDIIVDAICGTGFSGSLRPVHRSACIAINDAIAAVIALDIPTGVECDTGAFDSDAVRADFTVTFDSKKPAHILSGCDAFCGSVEVVDIGIPPEAKAGINAMFGSMTQEQVLELLPPRPADSHKGTFGRLLNISGSTRYRGAAILSTTASLRIGAGLTVLASTSEVCGAAAISIPEAILLPLSAVAEGGIDSDAAIASLDTELALCDAVLFGCGLGDSAHTLRLLEHVLAAATCPVIIDADGINALAKHIHLLQFHKQHVILTPHPGEMARLCGVETAQIGEDRAGYAMRFAAEHGVTLVLKGSGTLIASPDGEMLINQTGNPGLAKGGSGDVLAGMIAGLLAQGLAPGHAAACGVYLHGLAGDKAAASKSQYAMLPSDLFGELALFLAQNGR